MSSNIIITAGSTCNSSQLAASSRNAEEADAAMYSYSHIAQLILEMQLYCIVLARTVARKECGGKLFPNFAHHVFCKEENIFWEPD